MNQASDLKAEDRDLAPSFFSGGKIFPFSGGGSVAATGVDLKNSLCIAHDNHIEISPVLGNINAPEIYSDVAGILQNIADIDVVACDLHPDLHTTRLAIQLADRLDVPLIQVQHHHAHIAAVMAEFGVEGTAIGLALDGYGYGSDGSAWGGECLYIDGGRFERVGSLMPVPMPGGDAASREPWRMAVAWLNDMELSERLFPELPVPTVQKLCRSMNTHQTSSAGRLFDAASAIALGNTTAAFEGEVAIALEKTATGAEDRYPLSYTLEKSRSGYQLDCSDALHKLADAALKDVDRPILAAGFHQMLASGFTDIALRSATEKGIENIVLAGGCFLNNLLKKQVTADLEAAGFKVFCSEQLTCGDGAVALGQARVAIQKMQRGDL